MSVLYTYVHYSRKVQLIGMIMMPLTYLGISDGFLDTFSSLHNNSIQLVYLYIYIYMHSVFKAIYIYVWMGLNMEDKHFQNIRGPPKFEQTVVICITATCPG